MDSGERAVGGGNAGVVHPRGDEKYAQSIEAEGDRGVTWCI